MIGQSPEMHLAAQKRGLPSFDGQSLCWRHAWRDSHSVGTQSGEECNTRRLRETCGWNYGLMMDGDNNNEMINQHQHFLTRENILQLFDKYHVPKEFDLLSVDIDGNDYWVWSALRRYQPRVVIVEYNVFFLPEIAKTIAYDAAHEWDKDRYGLYHGASLAAFYKLATEKGYVLAWTEPYAPNAVFVHGDAWPEEVERPTLADWTRWHWSEDGYREPTPPPGRRWVSV